jgi:hypothetical protein
MAIGAFPHRYYLPLRTGAYAHIQVGAMSYVIVPTQSQTVGSLILAGLHTIRHQHLFPSWYWIAADGADARVDVIPWNVFRELPPVG